MLFSHVQPSATPWTLAHQALCPWDFLGKNTGVGCHVLLQGLPNGGIELTSPALQVGFFFFFNHWASGSPIHSISCFDIIILHIQSKNFTTKCFHWPPPFQSPILFLHKLYTLQDIRMILFFFVWWLRKKFYLPTYLPFLAIFVPLCKSRFLFGII